MEASVKTTSIPGRHEGIDYTLTTFGSATTPSPLLNHPLLTDFILDLISFRLGRIVGYLILLNILHGKATDWGHGINPAEAPIATRRQATIMCTLRRYQLRTLIK